jgi:protein-tyrosine phosphatase
MLEPRRVVGPPRVRPRLQRVVDLVLHPLYRWRAHVAVRRRSRPGSLLVVCHGNICRSPFAAALLARDLARAGVRVASAGFLGYNRPCPPEAVEAGARWGADLSTHRSTLVAADLARSADLILVMDPAQRRAIIERFGRSPRAVVVLGDLDPAPLQARAIRDPVEQGTQAFLDSYARIERCIAAFVRRLDTDGPIEASLEHVCL